MKYLFFVIVLCLLFTGNSFAQDEKLSLDDCIQIALENNSQLRISKYQRESVEKDVLGSYSGILPQVNFEAGYRKTQQGESRYIGGVDAGYTVAEGSSKSFSGDITLYQNIFDGGRWWNTIKQAKINDEAQAYSYQSQFNSIVGLVQERYYVLLKEEKLLEVYKLATQRSKSQLEKTEKNV